MNSASMPVSSDAAAAPAVNAALPAAADSVLPLDPALAAAQPGAQAPLAFLQFMQMDAALPAEPLPQPELAAVPAAATAQEDETQAASEAGQPLLAAMSMPLMPSMMAMSAGLPAAMRLAAGQPERQEHAVAAAAAELPGAGEATASAALPAQAADGAAVQLRAAAQASQPAAAAQAAAAPVRDGAATELQGAAGDAAGTTNTGFGIAGQSAPASAGRDGGTLTLSGPPTAWRQSLQEALGDRLNLQLGKNAEQAVIRLEPPMLGRVEISIRHAAGSLEVNITATHSEVLRQLNSVSDNLRSDLAQRQYTDVSVNVSQATPRAQAGAQAGAFGADAQGRGRQQGQDQDERAPGAALAEANQSTTAFSLSGRA